MKWLCLCVGLFCHVTFPSVFSLTQTHTLTLASRMNPWLSMIRCASTASRAIQRGHRSRTASISACSARASTAISASISRLSGRQTSVSFPVSHPSQACDDMSSTGWQPQADLTVFPFCRDPLHQPFWLDNIRYPMWFRVLSLNVLTLSLLVVLIVVTCRWTLGRGTSFGACRLVGTPQQPRGSVTTM